MTSEQIRSDIEREIAKLRGGGMWASGLFRYADGHFGRLALSDSVLEVSPGVYSRKADRWLVTIYRHSVTLGQIVGIVGLYPEREQALTLEGDEALIDWWLHNGPLADAEKEQSDVRQS